MWKDFNIEYNPLDAYRITETHSREKDYESDNEINYGKIEDSNSTDTGTVTNVSSGTTTTNEGTYGYNSINSVPAATSSDNRNDDSTDTRDLSNTNKTQLSGSDNRTIIDHEEESYTTTKSGNIGYTTPQELLRQDMELWFMPFFETVFKDIDSVILIQVYSI